MTPLLLAIAEGHNDTVMELLDAGANEEARNGAGDNVVHVAIKSANYDMAKMFIKHSIIYAISGNKMGLTALHMAAYVNDLDLVEFIKTDYNIYVTDDLERVPLHYAAIKGAEPRAEEDEDDPTFEEVARALADKKTLRAKDAYGKTPVDYWPILLQ